MSKRNQLTKILQYLLKRKEIHRSILVNFVVNSKSFFGDFRHTTLLPRLHLEAYSTFPVKIESLMYRIFGKPWQMKKKPNGLSKVFLLSKYSLSCLCHVSCLSFSCLALQWSITNFVGCVYAAVGKIDAQAEKEKTVDLKGFHLPNLFILPAYNSLKECINYPNLFWYYCVLQ